MPLNPDAKITFLGHATFLIKTAEGKNILVDPWLRENPACPDEFKDIAKLDRIDIMPLTHGHFDHIGDAVSVGLKDQPQVPACFELATYLGTKGLKNVQPMGKGGSLKIPGHEKITVTLTHAVHTGGIQDGDQILYGGDPCGLVIELEEGFRIYFAGDTCLFGDMKFIGELYRPDLAMIPIGDRFTMGPREAGLACKLLNIKKVIPFHFGTFPILTGTPRQFSQELKGTGIEMIELKPGQSC